MCFVHDQARLSGVGVTLEKSGNTTYYRLYSLFPEVNPEIFLNLVEKPIKLGYKSQEGMALNDLEMLSQYCLSWRPCLNRV